MPYRSHISLASRLRHVLTATLCAGLLAFAAGKIWYGVTDGALPVRTRGGDYIVDWAGQPGTFAFFLLLWLVLAAGGAVGTYAALRALLRR